MRNLDDWEIVMLEHKGISPSKIWLTDGKNVGLFKPDTDNEEGEVEYEVHKIADSIDIPCAKIEIAEYRGNIGCISYDVKPREKPFAYCAPSLLYERADGFTNKSRDSKNTPLDTVDDISLELIKTRMPAIEESVVEMLFLDCLVSNRDRHGQNWELIIREEDHQVIGIIPLFDHGYSLWNQYTAKFDNCAGEWGFDVEPTHFEMFEHLSKEYPQQIKDLLDKCADSKPIKGNEFVSERYTKMRKIFEHTKKHKKENFNSKVKRAKEKAYTHSTKARKNTKEHNRSTPDL